VYTHAVSELQNIFRVLVLQNELQLGLVLVIVLLLVLELGLELGSDTRNSFWSSNTLNSNCGDFVMLRQ